MVGSVTDLSHVPSRSLTGRRRFRTLDPPLPIPEIVHRRDLLRAFGAVGALSILPRDAFAIWTRVSSGQAAASGLDAAQLALVGSLADTILPRTDTPSATDVGVPAFVNVYVADYLTDAERATFVAGLERIDARARRFTGSAFADTTPEWRGEVITSIEADDRRAEPGRTYWRLKELVVHGYFTSERVSKDVLKFEIMPGRFDGDVALPERASAGGGRRDD